MHAKPRSKPLTTLPETGLVTVEEAALILDTSASTVWRYLRAGALKSWRHWGRTALARVEVELLAKGRATKESTR